MIEDAITVDDIKRTKICQRRGLIEIPHYGLNACITLLQSVETILAGVDRNQRTLALQIKPGMIAWPRPKLGHPAV
jgi:hypothetical protein